MPVSEIIGEKYYSMKIILSCTTTLRRSDLFYYCIQSLIKQSFQPDIFLVNISKEPYLDDEGFSEVPKWMNNRIVNVKWVENTGPYRKLLPALDYADMEDLIVTCDDDIIYGRTWLEQIVDSALENPSSIVCAMGRKMKINLFGGWHNYQNWHLIEDHTKGTYILPLGGAGAGYRKNNLDLAFLCDRKYLDIAPTTDDLWFKMSSLRKNIPVYLMPSIRRNITLMQTIDGLYEINRAQIKYKKFPLRFFARLWSDISSFLGMNQSRNDFSWDAICNYSKKKALPIDEYNQHHL